MIHTYTHTLYIYTRKTPWFRLISLGRSWTLTSIWHAFRYSVLWFIQDALVYLTIIPGNYTGMWKYEVRVLIQWPNMRQCWFTQQIFVWNLCGKIWFREKNQSLHKKIFQHIIQLGFSPSQQCTISSCNISKHPTLFLYCITLLSIPCIRLNSMYFWVLKSHYSHCVAFPGELIMFAWMIGSGWVEG